jgi:hypothetical protein
MHDLHNIKKDLQNYRITRPGLRTCGYKGALLIIYYSRGGGWFRKWQFSLILYVMTWEGR